LNLTNLHNSTCARLWRAWPRLFGALAMLALVMPGAGQAAGLPAPAAATASPTLAPFAPAAHLTTTSYPGGVPSFDAYGQNYIANNNNIYHGVMEQTAAGPTLTWDIIRGPAANTLQNPQKSGFGSVATDAQHRLLIMTFNQGNNAVRLSNDDGATWRQPMQPIGGPIYAVYFSPEFAQDHTVYLTRPDFAAEKMVVSTDAGEHWTPVSPPPGTSGVTQVVMSPFYNVDHSLFVLLNDHSIWRSPDAGITWYHADYNLGATSGNPVSTLAVEPLGRGLVMVVITHFATVISFDEGVNWYLITYRPLSAVAVPADYADSLTLFAIDRSSQQLLRTEDFGDTWAELLPGHAFTWLRVSPNYSYDHSVYVGNDTEVWQSIDGGLNWRQVASNAGSSYSEFIALQASPTFEQDHLAFAVSFRDFSHFDVMRTLDGARHWADIPTPGIGWVALGLSPAVDADHQIWMAEGAALYRSDDLGAHWSLINSALPVGEAHEFVVSPSFAADHTLFIGNVGQGIFRSTNGGLNWTPITSGVLQGVTDFKVSPTYATDHTLYTSAYSYGIYRSVDAGAHWTNVLTGCPDLRISLAAEFQHDQTVLAGCINVVGFPSTQNAFISRNGGNTWTDITDGVLNSYLMLQAISTHFDEDQTLMMASADGPIYLSEDAGAHWFQLPGVDGWSYSNQVPAWQKPSQLPYENGRLAPIVGHSHLYHMAWADLSLPTGFGMGLPPDVTGTVPFTLPLLSSTSVFNPPQWTATSNSSWFSLQPVTGTVPGQLEALVDADQVQSTQHSQIVLNGYLSLHTRITTFVQATGYRINGQLWLPVVTHNASFDGGQFLGGAFERVQALPSRLRPFVAP
jgi:photosystem II stability/assembly factor-like uncharacterized protein